MWTKLGVRKMCEPFSIIAKSLYKGTEHFTNKNHRLRMISFDG